MILSQSYPTSNLRINFNSIYLQESVEPERMKLTIGHSRLPERRFGLAKISVLGEVKE